MRPASVRSASFGRIRSTKAKPTGGGEQDRWRRPLAVGATSVEHYEQRLLQNTMLIAITGVMVALVLLPAANQRAPAITPMRLLKLYSTAGATPKRHADP